MKLSDKLIENRNIAEERIKDYISEIEEIEKEIEKLENTKPEEAKSVTKSFIFFILTVILGFIFFPIFLIAIIAFFWLKFSIERFVGAKSRIQNEIHWLERDKELREDMISERKWQIDFCNSQLEKISTEELNERIYTYVAGITFRKENKDQFLKLTKKDRKLNPDFSLRKSEMIEGERIWKYYPQEVPVQLKFEPDNRHDSNAVAVWYEDPDNQIKLGYVPKDVNEELTPNNIDHANVLIVGGPYKVLDVYGYGEEEKTKIYRSKTKETLDLEIYLK